MDAGYISIKDEEYYDKHVNGYLFPIYECNDQISFVLLSFCRTKVLSHSSRVGGNVDFSYLPMKRRDPAVIRSALLIPSIQVAGIQ